MQCLMNNKNPGINSSCIEKLIVRICVERTEFMTSNPSISVYNEIGKLKSVLLHRPGEEIENIVPGYLRRLLFDEIAYLAQAKREHDQFSDILRKNDVEVLYLTELMADILAERNVREAFLREFMTEGKIATEGLQEAMMEYFNQFEPLELIQKCIAGVRKEEVKHIKPLSLLSGSYPQHVLSERPLCFHRRGDISKRHG